MSRNPSGSFANNGYDLLEKELDRTIRRLNTTFGLQLRKPDPTLSPSKRRLRRQGVEEQRNDAIYEQLRALFYKRDGRLASCLGRFEAEARQLLSNATSHGSPGISVEHRIDLQRCLLRIFSDNPSANSTSTLAKRLSDGVSHLSHKRARGQPDLDHSYHSAVDALPVRSRGGPEADASSTADIGPRTTQETVHSTSHYGSFTTKASSSNSFVNRSFASSRTSLVSDVFSSRHTDNGPSGSLTTIESDYQDHMTHGSYSICTDANSTVDESFSRHDRAVSGQALVRLPPLLPDGFENTWTRDALDRTEFSNSFEIPSADTSANSFYQTSNDAPLGLLEDKLTNLWPRFPSPALTQAPLAVVWEVTRAALHCGVKLDTFDLKYDPNDGWHDQAKLRSKISTHPLFLGKGLPPSSDSIAWQTAMNEFHNKTKTVTLSAELVYNKDTNGPLYSLRLQPLKLELGHRLARRFGADRFLEITIPSPSSSTEDQPNVIKDDEGSLNKIVCWLTEEHHYFLGRSWEPFYVRNVKGKKNQNPNKSSSPFQERIYLFATNGNEFRNPRDRGSIPPQDEASTPAHRTNMKLSGLLEWAIGIKNKRNTQQPVMKLFSRLALSLSRTYPTIELERSQIRIRDKDLGIDKVMNDGIGRMSRSLAEKITKCLGLTDCPSCFQARLGSAKGMWLIDVNDDCLGDDWIEIYPSQTKWECDFIDPHHRTFEVRNWPSELKSASLNQQFIPVLEAQSINPAAMRQTIAEHFRSALQGDLDAQAAAMKEPMNLRLWVQQSGLLKNDRSLYGYAEFLGGLPDNNADKVAFLLDSGFDQRKMTYLKDLVWDMCTRKVETLRTKMNITIPCSAYVYMVADFTSTLEEGEVHLSFSTKFQVEGFSDTLLENMDILVARAPAHLPSDIQKVRVVSRPELRKLKDVIVFSTKGKTPLADLLSGGDYDGDMAWVCWDRSIANNFRNTPVPEAADLFKLGYLRKSKATFENILNPNTRNGRYVVDASSNIDRACHEFIYEAFSFNMQPSFLGKCTKYKERLCYHEKSVKTEASIVLSKLLGHLVDQTKQGIIFTIEDWKRLCTGYLKKSTFLPEPEYAKERGSSRPGPDGKVHVLDYLKCDVANAVIKEALTAFNQAIKSNDVMQYDPDLTLLYNSYDTQAKNSGSCKKLLHHLREKIRVLSEEWKTRTSGAVKEDKFSDTVKDIYQQWLEIKPPAEPLESRLVQELLRDRGEDPTTSAWELLKASATFTHHHRNAHKFVWYVAGKQLAFIKARMHPVPKETAPVFVIPQMWGVLRPDKKLIMALSAQREVARDSESAADIEEVTEFDDNGTVIDDA